MAGGERADPDRRDGVNARAAHALARGDELVDGYLVPVDPMDDLQCESCQ
jgi:hypothetical protein